MKDFPDDNFKFDENDGKFSEQVENTVGKGEIARYSVFKRLLLQIRKNQGLFLLCTYPVIPSFVHVCIYFEWFSSVAIFRTRFSFLGYCSGSFRAFLQSDY